ncbi:MAG TPA: nuclear transport factor 2 family protein [Actinomycetota bacterium]
MAGQTEDLANRYWEALNSQDYAALKEMYTEDAVQEWPQSGERIVGRDNIMAVNENYPGMPNATQRRTIAGGDLLIAEVTLNYPGDVGTYHSISIFELRDGKVARETDYFGAPFEAPAWRAQWVERM